jgi:hypothetical protein
MAGISMSVHAAAKTLKLHIFSSLTGAGTLSNDESNIRDDVYSILPRTSSVMLSASDFEVVHESLSLV